MCTLYIADTFGRKFYMCAIKQLQIYLLLVYMCSALSYIVILLYQDKFNIDADLNFLKACPSPHMIVL